MKRSRIAVVAAVLGLVVASCGSSSDSAPRQRNMTLPTNTPMRVCEVKAAAKCAGAGALSTLKWADAKISNSDFSGVEFDYLHLDGATIDNSNFSGISVSDVQVRSVSAINVSFVNARIYDLKTGASFTIDRLNSRPKSADVNFSRSNFSYAVISSSDFIGANLSNAKFENASLSDVDLSLADLTGVDFSHTQLSHVRAIGIIGQPKLPAGWTIINKTLVGPTAQVGLKENFDAVEDYVDEIVVVQKATKVLPNAAMSSCRRLWNDSGAPQGLKATLSMVGGKFGQAKLEDVDFSGVDLRGVDFSRMTLNKVNFQGANLLGAKFDKASLSDVDFTYANVTRTSFSLAVFKNISSGCTTGTPTSLPSNWKLVLPDTYTAQLVPDGGAQTVVVRKGLFVGPSSNFSNRNISGLDLRNVDLSNVTFDGATNSHFEKGTALMSGANGSTVSNAVVVSVGQKFPKGWGVRSGYLVGPTADLSYANLASIDLSGIDLSQAILQGAKSSNVTGSPVLADGYKLASKQIVGPGMNLDGAKLDSADLTDVSFESSQMEKTDLRRAVLSNVASGGIVGTPLLPTGWKIFNGYIFGKTANLENASTTGKPIGKIASDYSFNGLDLSRAKLENSDIHGFTGTPTLPSGWAAVRMNANEKYDVGMAIVGPTSSLWASYAAGIPRTLTLPSGFVRSSNELLGPKLDQIGSLNGVKFVGEIANVDLSESQFARADFSRSTFKNVRGVSLSVTATQQGVIWPSGWSVQSRWPIGSKVKNFAESVLLGPTADVSNFELLDIDLSGIDLSNANLSGTRGKRLKFDNATRLPVGWAIVNGFLLGPKANLSGVHLSDVSLDGIDLSEAELGGVVGKRLTGTPILPLGYAIIRGYLVGSGVDTVCSDIKSEEVKSSNAGRPLRVNALLDSNLYAAKGAGAPC